MSLPTYIWPKAPHSETTVMIRLGRVFHWLTIVLAAVSLLGSIAIGSETVADANRSSERAAEWDRLNEERDDLYEVLRAADREGDLLEAKATAERIKEISDELDLLPYRPFVSESQFVVSVLAGALLAFLIALFGRGVRYILADE